MKNKTFDEKFKNVLNYIRLTRKSKLINQTEISKHLQSNRSSYNQIENGNAKMTAIQLLEIASFLDISLSEIASIYENKTKTLQRTTPFDQPNLQPDYIENLQKLCSSQQATIEKQQAIIDTQQKLITSLELKLKL